MTMTSAIQLVGWDEAKGRPIYRRTRPRTTDYPNRTKVKISTKIKNDDALGGFDITRDRDAASGPKREPPPPTMAMSTLRGGFLPSGDDKCKIIGRRMRTAGKGMTSMQQQRTRKARIIISLSPAQQKTTEGCHRRDGDIDIPDERISPCRPSFAIEIDRRHPCDDHRIASSGNTFANAAARRKRRKRGYGTKTSSAVVIFADGAFLGESEIINLSPSPREESGHGDNDDEEGESIVGETPPRNEPPCSLISSSDHDREDGHILASPKRNDYGRAGDSSNASLNDQGVIVEEIHLQMESSQMQESDSCLVEEVCIDHRGYSKHNVPYSDSFVLTPTMQREDQSFDYLRTTESPQNEVDARKYGSDENDSPTFDPAYETPSTKGEESAISPRMLAQRDNNVDEFADFDIAFDDPESNALPREKRRSYGDVKPVWTSNNPASPGDLGDSFGVIGWDDAKCRPIYHAPPRHNIPSTEASLCVITSSSKSLAPLNDPHPLEETNVYHKRPPLKKVYATLFKKSGLSQAMRDEMDIDPPSPTRVLPSSCHFPLSVSKGRCVMQLSNNLPCIENEDIRGKKADISSCKQRDATRNIDLDVDSVDDDSNAHRMQPHSKTSLASARAFFRYLDSNHNLTIINQNESPDLKKKLRYGFLITDQMHKKV